MGSKISVIVPTFEEEKYIGYLLKDLKAQTYPPHEVIVVDGRSKDRTSRIVKKNKNVKYITSRANVAYQRHRGAKSAIGDLLVFLDADVRIAPNFLKDVNRFFAREDIVIACPLYFPTERHFPSLVLYAFFNMIFLLVQKIMPSGAGSCIIVRRKEYFEIGGFDERYTYDDMQLLSRSKKLKKFKILILIVHVSNRRIKKLGFFRSASLYLKLSWYFIKNDYEGANSIKYPFGSYS